MIALAYSDRARPTEPARNWAARPDQRIRQPHRQPAQRASRRISTSPSRFLNRVDEITQKILSNELFGGSLTWNLRRDEVDSHYDQENRTLHIFSGKPTIPDSNHRHQAIKKVAELVRTRGYNFDLNAYEFPHEIQPGSLLSTLWRRGLRRGFPIWMILTSMRPSDT